jgi:hypothetical protein
MKCHGGILSPRIKESGAFTFSGNLSKNEDRFRFEQG